MAASGQFGAHPRRGPALVSGPPGALAPLASPRSGSARGGTVPPERQFGSTLARRRRTPGAGDGARSVGGCPEFGTIGDRWVVGATARREPSGGVAPSRQREWGDLAPGRRRRRGGGGALA